MRDDLDLEACDLPELALPAVPAPRPKHGSKRPRRTRPRAKSLALKRMTREELRAGALMYPPVDLPRPRTRGDCVGEARPCPWVACKHHLYLDVNHETGTIKFNFPDLEPWDLPHTCALDVADRGGLTLGEVGDVLNVTRERVRQIEVRGLLKIKMAPPIGELAPEVDWPRLNAQIAAARAAAATTSPPPARRIRRPTTTKPGR